MIQSILDIMLVISYVIGFVINPLHREKRNGFSLCVVGIMLLIFWVGLAAGVYAFIGVPLTLASINAAVAMADLPIWILVFVKKKITRPVWTKVDAISLIILIGFVLMCSVIQFGWKLNLTYGGIDPARYMNMAMSLIREQKISGTYLATLINAWGILVCEAFVLPVHLYKGMILSDVLMHILSVWLFYVILAKINCEKGKILNPVISMLYFCGYQLYNLVCGAFFHWVDGILVIMFLIYIVWLLEEKCISNMEGFLGCIMGFFGLLVCYPYFIIIVVPLFLPEIIWWCKNNIKSIEPKLMLLSMVVLAGLVAVGWFFAGQRIGHSLDSLLRSLKTEGAIYKEPYFDFVLLLPILICYMGLIWRRKKESRMIIRMSIVSLLFIGAWFWLMSQGNMSMYYYYRMYYVLWLIAWLMVGHCVSIMMEEGEKHVVMAYTVFYVSAALLSAVGVNEKIYRINHDLYMNGQQTSSLFPLYRTNYLSATSDRKTVMSEQELQLCNYVIDNYEKMPIVYSVYSNMQANWYQGITGRKDKNMLLTLDFYSIRDIFDSFQNIEARYFAVFKVDLFYQRYKEVIFDKLEVVYENEDGAIYGRSDLQWVSLIDDNECLNQSEENLFDFVEDNYRGVKIPLLCERELWQKAEYYALYTGGESYDYWDMFTPETFIPTTYILNNNEVKYITILKDSEMYRVNQQYFDAQQIVYENDAGMLVQHAGTGWMPSEQEGW